MFTGKKSFRARNVVRNVMFASTLSMSAVIVACGSDAATEPTPAPGFLGGVSGNREIGLLVNATGKSITMFQLGAPTTQVQIALGTSSSITPVGLSVRARKAAVPLGNAASVAVLNLETATTERFFTFPSGNATGSAWSNDTTLFVANTTTNKIGRVYLHQTSTDITSTQTVGLSPSAVTYAGGRIIVVSANLDANFAPAGPGIITAIDPVSMAVLGTVASGGNNSMDAAVGPDGYVYVLNTDYGAQSTMTIINPATMTVVANVSNVGVGAGQISIDSDGMAFISSFANGTIVFNTKTRTLVRATGNEVCAKIAATGVCRGAAASAPASTGKLYQAFFGSTSKGQPPYVFVYAPSTYALSDSIPVGAGPFSMVIHTFN